MNWIELWDINYDEVTGLIKSLRDQGLISRQHYVFEYRPAWVNHGDGSGPNRRSARFCFHQTHHATWFALTHL